MIRIENILADFKKYTNGKIDCGPLQKAYILAAKSQSHFTILPNNRLQQALEIATILVDLKLDIQSIVSGILYGTLSGGRISLEEIEDLLGKETASIVEGMQEMLKASDIRDAKERIAEKMRLMIFASSKDIRIVFINLAARLVRMRHEGKQNNQRAQAVASETLQIYAPIADRLGLSKIKIELEELCFSYIYPKEFNEIQKFCKENEEIHQKTLNWISDEINTILPANKIEAIVQKRIKHSYSIFLKSKKIGVDYDQIHDLLGVRIIVNDVKACFEVLGLISSHFQPVTDNFKDYITYPKPNDYQSLHIDVYGKNGIGFDVQIRTVEMNDIAERGVAAHWIYKNSHQLSGLGKENISWLQDLSKSLDFASDSNESLEIFTRELYSDFVYVFSPKGKIFKLQAGSCVIDFAYAVHTEIGDTCVGAKINGRFSTIRTKLKQGDKIEVLTDRNRRPSSDWLYCAVSSKALTRIRLFLRKEERVESEKLGRELFIQKVCALGRKPNNVLESNELKEFLEKSGFQTIKSYYIHLGYGKENINDLENALFKPRQPKRDVSSRKKKAVSSRNRSKAGVQIAGIENMMVRYANCCNPVKGDKIVGLVTRGQGVSIHLEDCENIVSRKYDPERLINVEWIKSSSEKLPVSIHMTFDNLIKTNLQIMKILASTKVILVENNLKLVDKTTIQDLTIKVDNIEQLGRILKKLNMLPSVKATRKKTPAQVEEDQM